MAEDAHPVSELFDPSAWHEVEGLDVHRHHLPPARRPRHGADRVQPARGAQRLPAPHRGRAATARSTTPGRRPTSAACCSPATGPRPRTAAGRSARGATSASAARTATSTHERGETAETIDPARPGRLHILEVQRLIRFMPKVVIGVVPGWAAGGGHSLHVVVRPHAGQPRARPLQADRLPTWRASTGATARR